MKIKRPEGYLWDAELGAPVASKFEAWFDDVVQPVVDDSETMREELWLLYDLLEKPEFLYLREEYSNWHRAIKLKLEREKT